jgi:hypothetical protein
MRHLVAGALLTATAVAGGSANPAAAIGETCDGLPATIVGTPGTRLQGTPSDDVIVSNGATDVDGGDGNDVICTTASPPSDNRALGITGGRGSNVIDRRGDLDAGVHTQVMLYGDSDTFFGGPGADQVLIEKISPYTGAVSVQTGDGDDSVFVDHISRFTVPSTVDAGAGDDLVSVTDTAANLQVTGGDGLDTLFAGDSSGPGSWQADAEAGLLTFAPGRQLPFTAVEAYTFELANRKSTVDFDGSTRAETVVMTARGQLSSARMGGGDDAVRFETYTKPRTKLNGGPGRDRLTVLANHESHVHVDLA